MRYFYCLIIALTIAVSGQSFALDAAERHVSQEKVKNYPACPSQDFSEFLKVFSENIVIQRAFTKYPLKKWQLDLDSDPEPKPVLRNLRSSQISFPVIPGESERNLKSLTFRIEKIESKKAKLLLMKADTDYQISYFFSKNSCWNLDRIEDWSL